VEEHMQAILTLDILRALHVLTAARVVLQVRNMANLSSAD